LRLIAGFLVAELIAGKAEHNEAARLKSLVEFLQARVLRRKSALAGDIDDQQRMAPIERQGLIHAIDGQGRKIVGVMRSPWAIAVDPTMVHPQRMP